MSFKGIGLRLGNGSSSSSSSSAVVTAPSDLQQATCFDNDPLLAETLFLISRFLGGLSKSTFAQSQRTFDDELAASDLLGRVYHWSGSSRPAAPRDLWRKFIGCPNDQLLRHLRRSVVTIHGSSSRTAPLNSSYSLLRTLDKPFDSSSGYDSLVDMTSSKLSFKELVVRMIDNETLLYNNRKFNRELGRRKSFLLELVQRLTLVLDADHGDSSVDDSVKLLSAQEELEDIGLTLKHNDEKVVEIRRNIGRLYVDLAESNRLVCSNRRSTFDSGLCYLAGRQSGLIATGLCKASSANMRRQILTKYNFLCRIGGHKIYPVYTCCFDITGNFIITGGDDYLVKVWHYEEAALVHTLKGHKGEITIIQVSPDNAIVASACTLGSVRLWRLVDGQCLKVLQHGTVQVNYLKFNDLTYTISTVGDDGHCVVWDLHRILRSEEESITQLKYMTKNRVQMVGDESGEKCRSSRCLEIVRRESSHLFDWSATGDRLVLPHARLSNVLSIGNNESKLKIYILDVHPVENVLVTGGEDGIARLWTFRDVHRRETRALRETKKEMSAQGADALSKIFDQLLLSLEGHKDKISDTKFSNLGDRIVTGSDEDCTVRIWSFDKSYTKYEYVSLNMLDGSEDGESYFLQSLRNRAEAPGRGRRAPIRKKSQLYSVCWSVDDQYIVTLQSDLGNDSTKFDVSTVLKIWDSFSGTPLRTIKSICSTMCSLLVPHPCDPRIVATAGNDGFLNVWNIYEETNVARIKIPFEKQTPELEFEPSLEFGFGDVSFSPDGTKIVVTDTFGGLSLVGLEAPVRYERALTEQYFSTDYAEIVLDAEGFAIDAGTQLAVGVCPRGLLCRNDGSSYDDQPPAHRGPLPVDIGAVERRMRENVALCNELGAHMDRNITAIDFRRNNPNPSLKKSPPPLARKSGQGNVRTMDALPKRRAGNGNRDQGSNYKSEDTRWLYEISSDDASARDSDWGDRPVGGEGSAIEGDFASSSSNDDDDDLMEVDSVAVRSSSRIKTRKKHRSTRGKRPIDQKRQRAPASGVSSRQRVQSSLAVVTSGRAIYSGRAARSAVRTSTRLGASQSERVRYDAYNRGSSDDDFDSYNDDDDESDDKRRKRHPLAAPKTQPPRKRIRIYDSDEEQDLVGRFESDDDDDDDDNGNDDDEDGDFSSEVYTKSAPNGDTKKKSGRGRPPKSAYTSRQPVCRAACRSIYWDPRLDGIAIPQGVGVDRLWLQEERQYEYQYCPQVGDRVIYLPQGHTLLLQMFPENRQPPWLSWPARWPVVECEVRSVSYAFPTKQEHPLCHSIVAHVTLAISRIPINRRIAVNGQVVVELGEPRSTRNQQDHIIDISMRNYYTPDFIVPSTLFERTNSDTSALQIGASVEVYYKEVALDGGYFYQKYPCEVSAMRDANAGDWQLSPWENVAIQFPDGGDGEAISPWEAIFDTTKGTDLGTHETTTTTTTSSSAVEVASIPPGRATRNGSGGSGSSAHAAVSSGLGLGLAIRATRSGRVLVPIEAETHVANIVTVSSPLPTLSETLRKKIIRAIEKLMASNVDTYSPFHYEVDSTLFEDYYRLIPVPVYVDLILRRLASGYYRQLASLRADVDMIFTNCSLYNKPDTPILNAASLLRDELREIVDKC